MSYVAAALLVPAAGYLYLQLEERLPFATLLVLALTADAMVLALLRAHMLLGGPDWLALCAIIWVEVDWVIGSLVFWGLAERTFNLRQAKKYFGYIGAGEPAAIVAGGLAIPLILTLIAPGDLLWISSASLGIGAVIILRLTRRPGPSPADETLEPHEQAEVRSAQPRPDPVVRHYLIMVFAMIVIGETVHFFIDNAFYMEAERHFPREEELASFIGMFLALAATAHLICSLFVSRWVMKRFGIRESLLVLPVMIAALGALLLSGGVLDVAWVVFPLMLALKVADEAIRQGVYRPALLTLYQPLPPRLRTRAQTLGETVYEQIGAGGAGLILLLLNNVLDFQTVGLIGAAMLLMVVWIVQAWLVYPGYLRALSHALTTRQLDHAPLDLGDVAAREIIVSKLRSERPTEVRYSMQMLANSNPALLTPHLPALVRHGEPEVRLGAIALIERLAARASFPILRAQIESERDPLLRGALLRALAASETPEAVDIVAHHVDAHEPLERLGALVGLMEYGGIDGILAAGAPLLRLAASPASAERKLAVAVLQQLANPHFYRPLLPLLTDPDDAVRHGAVRAAAALKARQLADPLTATLLSPIDRPVGARALAALGEAGVEVLELQFGSPTLPAEIHVTTAGILGEIGSPRAIRALLARLAIADDRMQHAIARALHASGYSCKGDAARAVWRVIDEAADKARAADATRVILASQPWLDLLSDAVDQRVALLRERILLLLATVCERRVVEQARYHYAMGSAEQRAYAVELIDNLLTAEVRPLIIAVLEPASADRARASHEAPHSVQDQLRTLVLGTTWTSSWLRACALHHVGSAAALDLRSAVADCLDDADSIVRETAAWAVARLDHAVANPAPSLAGHGPSSAGPAMYTTVEKVLILKTVSIFKDVPDESLVDIASAVKEQQFAAGERFIEQDELGDALYIIVSGRVRVIRDDRVLAELGEREVVGELSALDPAPRSASVECLEETQLFTLNNLELEHQMAANSSIMRSILKILCERLRNAAAS